MDEGKLERRAAKAAKRAARAAAQDQALADIAIIWCEPTGVTRAHRGHRCEDCKTYTQTEAPVEDWDAEWPDPRPEVACSGCGKPARMSSKGLDDEMRRPDTGEVFRSYRDLPIGAVWEQQPWHRPGKPVEPRLNWISNRDKKGRPFPEPKEGEGKRCRFIDHPGPDGRVLICRLPDGHDWVIDSRANNCTLPLDDDHWCWNRSGRPEDATLDVRKGKPGQTTCSAGGGSIATSSYHGFLHDGRLKRC